MSTINPDPLLTIEDAAVYLDASPTTVRRITARGELQSTRIGRSVRFRVSHLEAYLRSAADTQGR